MVAKLIKSLELHYALIQVLKIIIAALHIVKKSFLRFSNLLKGLVDVVNVS